MPNDGKGPGGKDMKMDNAGSMSGMHMKHEMKGHDMKMHGESCDCSCCHKSKEKDKEKTTAPAV